MKLFDRKCDLIDRECENALYLIFLKFFLFLCNFDTSVFYNAYNGKEMFWKQKG